MKREEILSKAEDIVNGARQNTYGSPEDCFASIAGMWGSYLGISLSPSDVAMLMVLLKVARTKGRRDYADNYIDIAGYAACAGELTNATDCKGG